MQRARRARDLQGASRVSERSFRPALITSLCVQFRLLFGLRTGLCFILRAVAKQVQVF